MSRRSVAAAPAARRSFSLVELLPADMRSWLVTVFSVLITYFLVGNGFFLFGARWQIPAFVALVAAMVAATWLQGALIATIALIGLGLALPPALIGREPLGIVGWLCFIVLGAGVSAGVGWLRTELPSGRKAFAVGVSAVMVAWVLVNLWIPLVGEGWPPSGYATLRAETIRENPQPGVYVNDDAIYRRVFYLMHNGESYYQAFYHAWQGLEQKPALPNSVTAYRLPTMYWLWRLLPDDAFSIVYVFLAFVSVGCVAAAFITGQIVGARFAALAPLALAVYAMGSGTLVYVTYIDLPATCIALIGVALYIRSISADDRRTLWGAVAVLTLAALTREILVYLVVLAALSALLQPAERRLAGAVPWLVSLGIFALGYAGHAWAVRNIISLGSGVLSYAKGSPSFALNALTRFSQIMMGGQLVLPLLFLAGAAGAWGAAKRLGRPFAIFALVAIVLPVLGMMHFGNPGIDAQGHQVNYWGNLVVPLALALWPAWALLIPAI